MLFLILAFALNLQSAFAADPCERALNPIEALSQGHKGYGVDGETYALSPATQSDVEIQLAESVLAPYLNTEMAKVRWRHMLTHPLVEGNAIRERQQLVRYVADHPEEFRELRTHFKDMGRLESDFLAQFRNLGPDPTPIEEEILYAAFTIGSYTSASMVHFFGELGGLANRIQVYLLGQAYLSGAANAIKRAQPKRAALEPYRRHMQTVRLAQDPLSGVDNGLAQQMAEALSVISVPEKNRRFENLYYRLNAIFNRGDADLVSVVEEVPNGAKSLRSIYRRLLTLHNTWAVSFKRLRIPYDLILKGDLFHISNFRLRSLRALIVQNKNEIAQLFSALADLEVTMAMADFYNAHRDRLNFVNVVDLPPESDQPFLVLKDAHHPLIALNQPEKSKGNDVILGISPEEQSHRFSVIEITPGSVSLRYLSMVAFNSILTQTGLPIFVKEGTLTPVRLETLLQPPRPELGESRSAAVARRWAQIEKTAHSTPALVLLNDPFTSFGDLQNIAMTVAAIGELAESKDMGVLSTSSRTVVKRMQQVGGVDLLKADRFQVQKIEAEIPDNFEDVTATRQVLKSGGVSDSFVQTTESEMSEISSSRLGRLLRGLLGGTR